MVVMLDAMHSDEFTEDAEGRLHEPAHQARQAVRLNPMEIEGHAFAKRASRDVGHE